MYATLPRRIGDVLSGATKQRSSYNYLSHGLRLCHRVFAVRFFLFFTARNEPKFGVKSGLKWDVMNRDEFLRRAATPKVLNDKLDEMCTLHQDKSRTDENREINNLKIGD